MQAISVMNIEGMYSCRTVPNCGEINMFKPTIVEMIRLEGGGMQLGPPLWYVDKHNVYISF